MDIVIYNPARAETVRYGDLVEGRHAPLRITEVRHTEEGVDLFGPRTDSNSGRRERVSADAGETVRRLPDEVQTGLVWAEVLEAIEYAGKAWMMEDQDGENREAPPWRVHAGGIIASVGGRSYVVMPAALDEEQRRGADPVVAEEPF